MGKKVFEIAALMKKELDDKYINSKLHMHKALFLAQILAGEEEKLFSEKFEAWTYGPVLTEIHYGWNEIDKFKGKETKCNKYIKKAVELIENNNIWDIVEYTHEYEEWKNKSALNGEEMEYKNLFKDKLALGGLEEVEKKFKEKITTYRNTPSISGQSI